MIKISKKDINTISNLSKIYLSKKEVNIFKIQINKFLKFVYPVESFVPKNKFHCNDYFCFRNDKVINYRHDKIEKDNKTLNLKKEYTIPKFLN